MSKRILVVEDQEDLRAILRDFLSASGYTVIEAVDGAESVAKAAAERPAIISAFMDNFGEEGCPRFSRDLVITCELSKRTDVIATDLIRRYLADDLSYEAMASHAQAVSEREA